MQETGNNLSGSAVKILSIRLSPDGLSFTEGTEPGGFRSGQYNYEKGDGLLQGLGEFLSGSRFPQDPFDRVCLFPDTDRMVLVPDALWRDDMATDYLTANGLTPQPGERIVVSPVVADTRAVMLCSGGITQTLEQKFPETCYISPLQATFFPGKKQILTLLLTPSLLYLSYCGEQMEYAEALSYDNPADILYYLHRLSPDFDLPRATLRVAGHKDDVVTRLLKRYYKSVETADYARLLYSTEQSI